MRRLLPVLLLLAMPLAAAQAELNVATYNLRLDTPKDGKNTWSERRDAVRALVRYHGFDLWGTQEALANQLTDLEALDEYAHVGAGRDDGKQAGEHAAIFYRHARFALEAHGDFWLSETPGTPSKGWDGRCCKRIASWARLRDKTSGQAFLALNAHFDHEGVVARRESARLLLARGRSLAGPLPLIVMGDFNSTPDSEAVAIISAALHDARAVSQQPPYGPEATFNAFDTSRPAQERIDYIFLSPQWQVLRYAVLSDSIDARYPSDHFPVLARVRLP
ncbi:Metal-dependent hydrolase, endonuclease/exonuclease/phosphatase family [Duganella sp. CF402]|uniref:endonuclease/exonuclease/phosphatase family protein n=1 Tax=unclassified Duganella TaxID=2636909 RepID=UPI0008C85ED1|nr:MULTISPECIES: endonuclease/exonuclease/phosphatase family protein [unclassified Duganella]RZT10230.1 endonuclease/exonuclease/phosphatase family metal-dependent hydrolase [Duganella sp. BK701]SEL22581.1 Metal-dependent hydrolase, endonuclease/exonuclease/phosphatase family [Duganella sp. CF402]